MCDALGRFADAETGYRRALKAAAALTGKSSSDYARLSRHRRHAVGLLDAKRDDLRIRRIAPEQRDVGAVQRRDHPRHRAPACRDASTCRARYAAVACGIA